ncbi:unnamed protein product [Dovyalis caffra]|uniref:Uncharacterized protein n=1 Tax=Dovyalis caffra TaxID=77055 RepID=A0AAV1S917_9ROSI|nr:unnamed protein product [Dovyalis caffra]
MVKVEVLLVEKIVRVVGEAIVLKEMAMIHRARPHHQPPQIPGGEKCPIRCLTFIRALKVEVELEVDSIVAVNAVYSKGVPVYPDGQVISLIQELPQTP